MAGPGGAALPREDARRGHAVSARDLALVACGGAAGTVLRFVAGVFVPGPLGTFLVNVLGAFMLGLLLEALQSRGGASSSDHPRGRARLRLFLGTGVLGGFTSYSLLASDAAEFLLARDYLAGAGYALGSIALSLLAAALGALVARALTGRGRLGPEPPAEAGLGSGEERS